MPSGTHGWIQKFGNGGGIVEDFEMSQRSRQGDAKGIAGEECEQGLNPVSPGALPQKMFKIWVLSPAI